MGKQPIPTQVAQHQYTPAVNGYGVPLRRSLQPVPPSQPYNYPPPATPPAQRPGANNRYPPVKTPRGKQRQTVDDEQLDVDDLQEDDIYYPQRQPSSAKRYQQYLPAPLPPAPLPEKRRFHWLFWLGMVFCIMLVGWILLTVLSGFIQQKRDDLTYENPRIFQIDANVGHYGRMSHFVALNLDGYLEIFETQRGHPEVAKIYTPTSLLVNPSDPVTLSFQDVNGDGKPDMVITSPSFQAVMFNNGTTFQAQPPGH